MKTVQQAEKLTGLKTSTICKWARLKNQPKLGKGMYLLSDKFIDFLYTIKGRKSGKRKILN
jgi:hypothetical protein